MQPDCVDCGLWKVERSNRTQARRFLMLLAQAGNAAGAPGADTMIVMHSRRSHFSDNLPTFGRGFLPSEVVWLGYSGTTRDMSTVLHVEVFDMT